jgi:hypothetical protein
LLVRVHNAGPNLTGRVLFDHHTDGLDAVRPIRDEIDRRVVHLLGDPFNSQQAKGERR